MKTKSREWQYIRESDKIALLLREKVKRAKFFLKASEPPAEIYRGSEVPGGGFEFQHTPDLQIQDLMTLYATLNRQLEIDFEVVSRPEEGLVIAKPTEARISKVTRENKRINVLNNEVQAGHFQVSKSELAVDNTRPQVANKVIYTEYERILSQKIPGLKIYDFANRDRPQETHFLDRETKAILVSDLSDEQSYRSDSDDFLDYYELLEDEDLLDKKRKEYLDKQYGSLLVYPLLYEMANGSFKPIAFFYALTDKSERIDPGVAEELKQTSAQIVDRILDANMITIADRQKVIDISRRGLLLELTHPDLIKYVPNSRVMTFDLIFKMQAPLRFRGVVRHIRKTDDTLLAGISIEGTGAMDGARKDNALSRLENLVQILESN